MKEQEGEELIDRSSEPQLCKNYIPIQAEPYIKTKLKKIQNNKWLFPKDATLHQVMYKIHKELDGAKNLYFYIIKKDGKFAMLKPELKLMAVFKKHKEQSGYLRVVYHNDMISKNKVLDNCFIFAQIIVVAYLLLFIYGYLQSHEYI